MAIPRAKMTRSQRDLMRVKKIVYPNMMTLMLLSTVDVMHPTTEQLQDIIDGVNRYAGQVNDGLCDLDLARKSFERQTGRTVNNVLYGIK